MTQTPDSMAEGWINGWQLEDRRPASQIAAEMVIMPGSAFGDRFLPDKTPWNIYPLDMVATFNSRGEAKVRTFTHVKPVQAGGSLAGEAALCLWLRRSAGGDIQYNWENDEKALERWDKRIEKILKATVGDMFPDDRTKSKRGKVIFDRFNLTVQGVWTEDNLDSDSIRYQINEEVHNWEPGRLEKAYNRTTAYLDSCVRFNISNASRVGDQLHRAFESGTKQYWTVKCPRCGLYHAMHTALHRDGKPGGLRYDSDGCKREDGTYDYNRLAGTIYYEFDCCGYRVPDDPKIREKLSTTGIYSEPTNTGAHHLNRSTTLEAVSVHYIPFLELIAQKHSALRALKSGDPEPWWRYLAERECKFYNPEEDRPTLGSITLNTELKKSREGLPNRAARFGALDRQQGSLRHGELPHWWCVIRDVAENADSRLVWEGKCLTDEEAVDVLRRHNVHPTCVAADSGDDTTHVYSFCLRYGFNAIKGASEASFSHPDGGRRIFSPEKELHLMMNMPKTRDNPLEEPQFWFYSKQGIAERLHWWRSTTQWEVPSDVSDDYKSHLESWELSERKHARTGETITEWVQVKRRDDLLVLERYIAMLAEMAGFIGQVVERGPVVKEYQLK